MMILYYFSQLLFSLLSNLLLSKFQKLYSQKQSPRGVPRKRCSENMQQIYRRTPMPKCDFNKVAKQLRHGCSPLNLLHIFRTLFLKNTSDGLLLYSFMLFRRYTIPFFTTLLAVYETPTKQWLQYFMNLCIEVTLTLDLILRKLDSSNWSVRWYEPKCSRLRLLFNKKNFNIHYSTTTYILQLGFVPETMFVSYYLTRRNFREKRNC